MLVELAGIPIDSSLYWHDDLPIVNILNWSQETFRLQGKDGASALIWDYSMVYKVTGAA